MVETTCVTQRFFFQPFLKIVLRKKKENQHLLCDMNLIQMFKTHLGLAIYFPIVTLRVKKKKKKKKPNQSLPSLEEFFAKHLQHV